MARAPMAGATRKRTFHQELVLNRWVLGFFLKSALHVDHSTRAP